MASKKKLTLLSVTGLLSVLAVGVAASVGSGKIIGAIGEDGTVWKHYAAVEATYTTHGSKEFWASCSDLGTHVFTAPTSGTIEEGGNFADTIYFTALEETDDRYIAKKVPSVTFDARGGVAVDTQEIAYGTTASELPTTTREADAYYESYEFGGWYKDGTALADTDTITESVDLKAGWKYGNAKKVYVNDWNDSDFELGAGITPMSVSALSGSTLSDDEGFLFRGAADSTTNTVVTPAVNFGEILNTVPVIYMYVGGAQANNRWYVTTTEEKKLPEIGVNDVTYLTQTLLSFTKDSSGKVHMHFIDTKMTNPMDYDGRANRSGDWTLTDEQANGTAGIKFDTKDRGDWRKYWIGRPFYISGEENYLDITTKTGYSVTGADVKLKTEASGAGLSFWYEAVGGADQYVVLNGNNKGGGADVTFDAVNLNTYFENGKGVKFNVGAWNGNETIYFNNVSLGVNGPNESGVDPYTFDSIEKTFHNWDVSIDDIGLHAYNKNEDKTYDVALTAGQIAGTESIKLTLGNLSNGRFFYLSDVSTYHF